MIEVKKLVKTFRRTKVLRGLDLEMARGDRVALVGSNGAGKTTLIRCLLGEYTHEGLVAINGMNPRRQRTMVLGRIGFVPQLPPPLKMTVGQLVDFTAKVCGASPRSMEEVAEALGLNVGEIKGRPFVKLSGGEKQKMLIGLALGRETDLLIMDEPAANLDPAARQVFFRLLEKRKEQVSMLISSHRLDEVASLVNRVIELDRGRIVLNDHVDDSVDMAAVQRCRLVLARAEPAFAKAIKDWDFTGGGDGLVWTGEVAGPDRLRFLGVLSRYAALLRAVEMKEGGRDEA